MSYAEDMGYDAYTRVDMLELNWEDGYHTTKDGIRIALEDMELGHLKNTINHFRGKLPIAPLEKELKRRAHKQNHE